MFIFLVINDVPQELGEIEIIGVFSNKKAAETEVTCLRQLDNYANQYTKILVQKLRDKSIHTSVRKRTKVDPVGFLSKSRQTDRQAGTGAVLPKAARLSGVGGD